MSATLIAPTRLRLEDLEVTSYATTYEAAAIDPYCCTGCDSGCGINPTAGGCESGATATQDKLCAYCCTGCDSGCGIIPTGGGCESAGGETGEGVCW
jgi:hypothetical protein